ncbi:MAG: nitroreductase family protein [Candidatus Cloacimonadaceae bacterium]
MIYDLIRKNRSYRRFQEAREISRNTLAELIDLARLSPSAANLQELRFRLVYSKEEKELVFPCLKWANYLTEWDGPVYGQRPGGYILVLAPKNNTRFHYIDAGIACQSMLLGATAQGLGGCMIASMNRERLEQDLLLPAEMDILLAIALGVPDEEVLIDDISKTESIKYYRDEKDRHRVPKLKRDELIIR